MLQSRKGKKKWQILSQEDPRKEMEFAITQVVNIILCNWFALNPTL
jgi:hypothetical protein